MGQFNYEPLKRECVICKKPTYISSTDQTPYCSRVCESEAKFRGRYFGLGSENKDRSRRAVGKL